MRSGDLRLQGWGASVISDLGLCLLSLGSLPTGMTEHTKNLLRAFYELSQTHRGNGIPRHAMLYSKTPVPQDLVAPNSEV